MTASLRILFVENHDTFARIVASQFLGKHTVTIVPSLAAARDALDACAFDAILLDYDLDDGKGDVLVCELRHAGSDVFVVAISARDKGNEALLAAGANALCRKGDFHRISELLVQAGG